MSWKLRLYREGTLLHEASSQRVIDNDEDEDELRLEFPIPVIKRCRGEIVVNIDVNGMHFVGLVLDAAVPLNHRANPFCRVDVCELSNDGVLRVTLVSSETMRALSKMKKL